MLQCQHMIYLEGLMHRKINTWLVALIIGIIVGTYSSIYVAGSLAVMFGLTRGGLSEPRTRASE